MSVATDFTLSPDLWTEIATLTSSVVVQNVSANDILVRVGTTLPAVSLVSGMVLGGKQRDEFASPVLTEKLYARAFPNTPTAQIHVWS